ncbi:hypothetical protein WBP06_23540 [Novosphingobium sp. BL-8H]|uniref:hypothetical protein n=1 Tax=Novosphingobium sp. BL-8H TaxID=3127640 RepID=UPI0037563888
MHVPWWSRRDYNALLILLMVLPLLWPAVIPLEDLPGHMGRFRIQAGVSDAPTLAETFSIHWMPVGNLGIDLIVLALQPVLGIELATKLAIILLIITLLVGLLIVIKEAHGEIPATAAFALPLAYAYPFQFGFVNFWLASGLALLIFGLVLRYQRLERSRAWRLLILFGSLAIYFAHIFGWVFFALMVGGNSLYRHFKHYGLTRTAIRDIILEGLLLCLPLVFIALWRSTDSGGETSSYFDIFHKWGWIESSLRDRWVQLDGQSALGCVALIILGLVGALRMNPRLLTILAVLTAFYLFIPFAFHGLIYADMRIAPLLLAIGIAALAPRAIMGKRVAAMLAIAALVFVCVRTAAMTYSYVLASDDQENYLLALDHIPKGSRVVALVAPDCPRGWSGSRITSLASMAIVRRDAFVNAQFEMPGAQLVAVSPSIPREFAYGTSSLVRLPDCDRPEPKLAERIDQIPYDAFDHVWLLGVGPNDRPSVPQLRLVWSNNQSAVYAIASK